MKEKTIKCLIVEQSDYDAMGLLTEVARQAVNKSKLVYYQSRDGGLLLVKNNIGTTEKSKVKKGAK